MRLINADELKQIVIGVWRFVEGDISLSDIIGIINDMPTSETESQVVRCKDCKHWKRQAYNGNPLSFGFCESDDMWRSLYGETYEVAHIDTDDDFYCGYAERRTDE